MKEHAALYDQALTDFAALRLSSSPDDFSVLQRVQAGFMDNQKEYESHVAKIHRAYRHAIGTKELAFNAMEKQYK
jgi:hypothetical protein